MAVTVNDVLKALCGLASAEIPETIDTLKAGDGERTVNKAAFCFIATPDVIRAAVEYGAELIVTHEPTYHDHFDRISTNGGVASIEEEKRALIESSGISIIRFHDHAHLALPDLIHDGFVRALGLEGRFEGRNFIPDRPLSPHALARLAEEKLGIRHVRISGNPHFTAKKLTLFLGACGDTPAVSAFTSGECELAVCGETCEWRACEYVRDAAQLGHNAALLMLGHVGSERDGMRLLAPVAAKLLGIETRYIECGEAWSFTEDAEPEYKTEKGATI